MKKLWLVLCLIPSLVWAQSLGPISPGSTLYDTPYSQTTPTHTPTSGSFTATSTVRSRQIGITTKTYVVHIAVTVSNAGTGSGFINLTIPNAAAHPTACAPVNISSAASVFAYIDTTTFTIIPASIAANTWYVTCVYEG